MTEHPDMMQLSTHLDGELDSTETATVSEHLLRCRECQQQYQQMHMLTQDLRQLPDRQPELDIGALLAQLPERPGRLTYGAGWLRALPGMAAAALVLGLLIGANLQLPDVHTSQTSFPALAILDSTPPGALCRQPELCYLKGSL